MDYSKMKATKKSQPKKSPTIEISKTDAKKAGRALGKLGISWILVFVCLIVGVFVGFGAVKFVFKNDVYQMNTYAGGNADVYIGKDEDLQSYTELGVKCVAFGKDCSKDCTVTYFFRNDLTEKEVLVDGVDASVPGIYYAVYKCPNFKYSSVTLIRNIIVLGEEDNG